MVSSEVKKTLNTLEIAEMMDTKHYKILEKLEGTKDGKTKGIIPVLADHNFVVSDYFIESDYVDGSGKTNKCYLATKIGCDFLANKFTGEKGILFTAKYVKRFDDMEKQLEQVVYSFQIEDSIERAKAFIKEQEATKKLLAKKDKEIEDLSPFAKLARERMDKTGTINLTSATKTFELKTGQISVWAKLKGYLNKAITEVNKDGEEYFKCIEDIYGHKGIAIKEEGIKLIDKNIEAIKNSPCKFNKKLLEAV
jgi:phage regulator Rha-like protein